MNPISPLLLVVMARAALYSLTSLTSHMQRPLAAGPRRSFFLLYLCVLGFPDFHSLSVRHHDLFSALCSLSCFVFCILYMFSFPFFLARSCVCPPSVFSHPHTLTRRREACPVPPRRQLLDQGPRRRSKRHPFQRDQQRPILPQGVVLAAAAAAAADFGSDFGSG